MGPQCWVNQREESRNPEHIWKTAVTDMGASLYGKDLGDPKHVDDKKQ